MSFILALNQQEMIRSKIKDDCQEGGRCCNERKRKRTRKIRIRREKERVNPHFSYKDEIFHESTKIGLEKTIFT